MCEAPIVPFALFTQVRGIGILRSSSKDAEQADTVRLADLAPLRLVIEDYVGQHPEL
jgi:hypothetical protein